MKRVGLIFSIFVVSLLISACGGYPSTPSGVVEKMFNASFKLEYKKGQNYVAKESMQEVERQIEEYEKLPKEQRSALKKASKLFKFKVLGEEINGDSAEVTVELSGYGTTAEETIDLVKEDGNWKVIL